jgi:hypothetical protein
MKDEIATPPSVARNDTYIFSIISESVNQRGLFTSRGCCKCEARFMKLWFTTANVPQQSRCGEIGSPEG